jgi:hypothetical protein
MGPFFASATSRTTSAERHATKLAPFDPDLVGRANASQLSRRASG